MSANKKSIILSKIAAVTLFMIFTISLTAGCEKKENNTPTPAATTKTVAVSAAAKTSMKASAPKTSAAPAPETTANASAVSEVTQDTGYFVETEAGEKIDIILDTVKEEDVFDLGGRVVILGGYGDIFNASLSETNDPVFRSRLKAAEQKYNFKFELDADVMNMNAWDQEIISATIAGVKYADAIRTMSSVAFPNHFVRKIAVPLDDYIDFESPIMKANQYQYNGTYFFGKHWGLTNGDKIFSNQALMFNKDIIEREGQPYIIELAEKNQWTWEAFLEIARNCTRDFNGDGIFDQWGISSNASNMLAMAVLASNGCTVIDNINNNYEYALASSKAIRAVQFFADLILVHKVVKFDVNSYSKGQAAMYYGYLQSYRNATFIKGGLQSQLAPHPMGPDVNYYQNISTFALTEVLSTCDIPREVAIIMNDVYLYWDENLNSIPEIQAQIERIEKEQGKPYWKQLSRDRCLTEREYKLCYEVVPMHYKPDVTYGYPNMLNLMTSLVSDPVMKGTMSVSQAVNSARDQMQDIVDQYK